MTPQIPPALMLCASGNTINVFHDLAAILNLRKLSVFISFLTVAHCPDDFTFLFFPRFARLAATTFITQGIPVYLFSGITPTPFVVSNHFLLWYPITVSVMGHGWILVFGRQKSSLVFVRHSLSSLWMFPPTSLQYFSFIQLIIHQNWFFFKCNSPFVSIQRMF